MAQWDMSETKPAAEKRRIRRGRGKHAKLPLPFINMDKAKVIEIRDAAQAAGKDAVKAQIAGGAPKKGMDKARHIAVVAYAIQEVLSGFGSEDDAEQKAALRAALSGSLLNASQFRQQMEEDGILEKTTSVEAQYDV